MDTGFGGADDGASRLLNALSDNFRSDLHLMSTGGSICRSVMLILDDLWEEVIPTVEEVILTVEEFIRNVYYEFKLSLHPSLKFKHLQTIIIPSAWLGFYRDGLAQSSNEIVFREVGKDKYRIECKKASRGVWVDVENTPLLTAEENESDYISTNRGKALDGALLSRNTSPVSLFLEIEADRGNARDGSGQNHRKVPSWEWIFVVSNLIVELPSVVFDQLSSPHKPLYALMAMVFSLLALDLCVIDLLYKGVRGRVTFKRPEGKIPWFYYPSRSQNHKPFGTFADLIGLVSAICQCIVTAINYDFARRAADSPIKFSLLPIIFALGLLCSRILETVEKKPSETR